MRLIARDPRIYIRQKDELNKFSVYVNPISKEVQVVTEYAIDKLTIVSESPSCREFVRLSDFQPLHPNA